MAGTTLQWADYDLFWHLANGRLMVEAGLFPSPDRFSWSMAGQPYVAHFAQVDRLLYLLWTIAGAPALALFSAVGFGLAMLPFALLVGRLTLRPVVELVAVILIALAMLPFRGARPHVLAFVLFGLITYLLERPFGARAAVLVGLALGAWANLHGTFQIGFAMVGAGAFAALCARDTRSLAGAALAMAIGVALSLLSPFGLRLWYYPLQLISNPYLVFNEEWISLQPFSRVGWPMGLWLVTALGVGIWQVTSPRAVAAIGLVLPAIQKARFASFAAPLLAVVALEQLANRVPSLKLKRGSPLLAPRASRMITIGSWALLLLSIPLMSRALPASLEAASFSPMPVRAVDRLIACGQPAPVWSHYNWGGYLLWRGESRYTVGMDGRAETLYSNQVLGDYYTVAHGEEGWQAVVQDSPAQYALIPTDAPAAIDTLPGWRRLLQDDVATLAARDGAPWQCS